MNGWLPETGGRKPDFDWEAQKALDARHLESPEIGDYWQEMFTPILVVVAVGPSLVFVLDKTRSVDDDHWTWDLGKPSIYSRDEFRRKLCYGTGEIADQTWCHVRPRAHARAAEEAWKVLVGKEA